MFELWQVLALIKHFTYGICVGVVCMVNKQGFMQDKILASLRVLVDTWILAIKLVDKLYNVSDDLKWTTDTHVTPFTLTSKALEHFFCSFIYLSIHPYLPVQMTGGRVSA